MSELRKEFEKIAYKNKWNINKDPHDFYVDDFVNGAWWAFQEQQAKIDELAEELSTTKQVLHNVIDMERAKKIELEKKINANKEKISYALKHNGRCNETTIRVLEGILNDQSN